jgi:hypothetical protein
MTQEQHIARGNARKSLVTGVVLIAVSVCSWPVVYLWAAFRMLNNDDATTGEWVLAYTCIYGPGVGVAIGLAACIYAGVQRKGSHEETIRLSVEIEETAQRQKGRP